MINDIKKDMIEQLSYFIETNPKGYLPYDDVEELFNGVLEKYDSLNAVGYFDACKQLQAYKDKEDRLREELLIWGEVMNPKLQNKLLQILNEGDK